MATRCEALARSHAWDRRSLRYNALVHRLAYLAFFGSGFAALLYQVVWQRLLATFSGTDVFSITVIVAAFMGGLGIGSLAGGKIGDRLGPRANLALFAAAELAIGGFGYISKWFYYDVLYLQFGHLATMPGVVAAVLFASLLWPTFFMGLSLPLLSRGLTKDLDGAARTVGSLYGWNTLGAATGAIVTTWFLLPQHGLDGSLYIGVWANVACGVLAVPLAVWSRTRSGPRVAKDTAVDPSAAVDTGRLSFWAWCLIYALSGAIALSLEVVWFRLLGVLMKASAFSFGTLLAIYLAGLGLGAAVGSAVAPRCRRPARVFFAIQTSVGLSACLVAGAVVAGLGTIEPPSGLMPYLGRYAMLDVYAAVQSLRTLINDWMWGTPDLSTIPWLFLKLYFGLPALMIGLPTLLMGLSFPFLQRAVQTRFDEIGWRTGALMVSNIVGSLVGTVVTGWILLQTFGTSGTLRLAGVGGAAFLVLEVAARDRRATARAWVLAWAAAAAVATIAIVAVPSSGDLWARLHGTTPERILHVEDETGLSVIKLPAPGSGGQTRVFVNGTGHSWIPYGEIHTVLGALPALMHPSPRDIVVIGLGSGNTCFSAATRPETERVTCLEIVRSQLASLRLLQRDHPDPGVASLLANPRIRQVYGDGRAWLRDSGQKFDIIEADALYPDSPYSGNVYSDGYFRLLRDHLKPGGVAVTWAPSDRIFDAFLSVFPHVLAVGGVAFGSDRPVPFDQTAIAARLADPLVLSYYQRVGLDLAGLITPWFDKPLRRYGPDYDRSGLKEFNTDLFPRDEYFVPRLFDWSMLRPPGQR